MVNDLFSFFFLLLILVSSALSGNPLWAPALPLAIFSLMVLWREVRKQKRLEFVNQLKSHRRELRAGGTVVVDSMLVRYDTPLTSYFLSIGIVLTSIDIPSRYRISSSETQAEGMLYSFITFLTGWWSITGPLHSLATLGLNLQGGEKTTVALLVDKVYLERNRKTEIKNIPVPSPNKAAKKQKKPNKTSTLLGKVEKILRER